ncbi:MAG: peptidylprolyl isomerase [Gammaproteobacteria bacterium]|nr:peptidylprolyl isomerase [Gammaproteobacteria bacterium]
MKFYISLFMGAALLLGVIIGLKLADLETGTTGSADQSSKNNGQAGTRTEGKASRESVQSERMAGEAEAGKSMELDEKHVRRIVSNLDTEQRRKLINDKDRFHQLISQEAKNLSVEAAARANDVDDNDNVKFLMNRAANNVLRQSYLNILMREQLPGEFPTKEQVKEFFENNRDQFVTDERVQVWQIFLPGGDRDQDSAAAESKSILDRIRQGDLAFADAAVEYSAHEPSKQNDGYMGAVPVKDLKPVVADALKGLEEDELARVESEDGWHIIRKGRSLLGRQLELSEIEPEIRRSLVERVKREFQQSIYKEAGKEYSEWPGDERVEEWRQDLLANPGI